MDEELDYKQQYDLSVRKPASFQIKLICKRS